MNDFTIDRYTAAQMAQIVGRKGQVAVDLTNNNLVVHDGVTRGGVPALNAAGTATLTNKTVNLSTNTLTGTTAQFNSALSDGDFATLAGAEALTNKTLTGAKFNDSLILLTLKVTTLPTITGGSLFVHTSDIHHQSTGLLSTKNSAPNYYT